MRRALIACFAVGLAACGPNNVGSGVGKSSGGGDDGGSSGAGTSGGTSGTTSGSTDGGTNGSTSGGQPAPYACPGNPALTYPGDSETWGVTRSSVFPDYFLGGGYWNPSTTPVADTTLSPETVMAFHLLYCSGFKYALLDVSTVWCPNCRNEAADLPGWTGSGYAWNGKDQGWIVKWLPMGGIVFSVLEESQDPTKPATLDDLNSWIAQYHTNYPMAIDPQQNLISGLGLTSGGFPANLIIDLSDMKVVNAVFGNDPTFYTDFDAILTNAK